MFLFSVIVTLDLVLLAMSIVLERKGKLVINRQLPRQRPRTRSVPTHEYPILRVYDPVTPFGYFISNYFYVIPLVYSLLFLSSVWFLNLTDFELFSSLFPLLFLVLGTENVLRCFFYTEIYVEFSQEQTLPPPSPDPIFYYDFPSVSLFGRY